MAKTAYPLSQVYRLLEPGPVVMITTARGGRANVMTMTWNTMIDFDPPLVGLVISELSHTFGLLKATKECVINIPTARLAKKAVECGKVSGRRIDKFKRFGLTPVPASIVGAPLVDECFANLECRVVDDRMARKYDFFVVEVVKAWIDRREKRPRLLHHHGRGVFTVDGRMIRLPFRG